MGFRLVSYNVLADSYIRRSWYPNCTDEALEPVRRRAALCDHIVAMEAAVICMQEVEAATLEAVASRLAPAGYQYSYLSKSGNKPDGCATFFDGAVLSLAAEQRIRYADGRGERADSGHVALVTQLEHEGRTLSVANTHIRWSAPDTAAEESFGHRQLGELAELISDDSWVVCGDFNLKPEAAALELLRARGLRDVYADSELGYSCNPNGEAKRIDFIFCGEGLAASACALPEIHDATPLPSLQQPSDHLAIAADLSWR